MYNYKSFHANLCRKRSGEMGVNMRILIKNIDIITMSDSIIDNGFIAIENDMISYVGVNEPKSFNANRIIDGNKKLALPGLINSHTHCAMTLLRSYADDMHLEKWLFDYIFPVEAKFTSEDVYWGSMLGIAEMIKSGTTCFADMYYFMDEVGKAVTETGIRACLSRGCQKFDSNDENGEKRLKENIKLYNMYKNNDLINIFIGPHAVYTCIPEYLKECYHAAKELQTGLHIHLSETRIEVNNCIEKYGVTPIEHCYNIGILDDSVIAAHCVHPTEKEIDIIRDTRINVVHNPGSNLKLASGVAPVHNFLENGVNLCLGTDGASSNNNLNMFEEIYLAGIVNKGINYDASIVKAYDVLKMATINGAKALNFDDIGSIEVGNKADIIILDINKPHFYPKHNIISNIVYSAQGSDVNTVIVNGKILLDNGEFTTIDFEKVKYNVDKVCSRIFLNI